MSEQPGTAPRGVPLFVWPTLAALFAVLLISIGMIFSATSPAGAPRVDLHVRGGADGGTIAIPSSSAPRAEARVTYDCGGPCTDAQVVVRVVGDSVDVPDERLAANYSSAITYGTEEDGTVYAMWAPPENRESGGTPVAFPCESGDSVEIAVTLQARGGGSHASSETTCS